MLKMITCKTFEGRAFENKAQVIEALKNNLDDLMRIKMAKMVKADAMPYFSIGDKTGGATKNADGQASENGLDLVLNCCNVMDSHDDVHLPGNYNKTVKEQGNGFPLLQEHQLSFKSIINNPVKADVQLMPWKSLGAPYEGETEVLLFPNVKISDRNAYMKELYSKGEVDNHSIGFWYVPGKLKVAANDEDWPEAYETYQKYIDQIVNKEQVEAQGFFFAVHEIKLVEGSAVPIGSNIFTPTLEAGRKITSEQPHQSTAKQLELIKTIQKQLL